MKKILVLTNNSILSAAFRYRIYYTLLVVKKRHDVQVETLCLYSERTSRILASKDNLSKLFCVIYDVARFFISMIFLQKNMIR